MRISDWSSDVCSSDLPVTHDLQAHPANTSTAAKRVCPRTCRSGQSTSIWRCWMMQRSGPRAKRFRPVYRHRIRRRAIPRPGGCAEFCHTTKYLIDIEHEVIVDVDASTAVPLGRGL